MSINEILTKTGMTKYRLAKLSGVPHATLNDICSGKTRIEKCSGETLYKLAKALSVSMETLMESAMDEQSTESSIERSYEYGLPGYLQKDLDAYKDALENGSTLTERRSNARNRKHNVGKLILPTGRIVMCSPDNEYAHKDDYSRRAFALSVPRGEYPVTLYVSNSDNGKELAFAEICFRDTIPISYSEASTQKDIELKRKGYKGYVVNDDRTGLMDAETYGHVSSQRTVIYYEEDDSFIEDEDIQSGLCNIISTPNNALLLSVRSGVYYWYWGKDKDKNICNLVGDFFSFN